MRYPFDYQKHASAETQSQHIIKTGIALTSHQLLLARCVGVAQPDRIRIKVVPSLPLPDDPDLRAAAIETGLIGPNTAALTIGYGIYFREGEEHSDELIAHECRHVRQFERYGSIENFLRNYLPLLVLYGYDRHPLEAEANMAVAKCLKAIKGR